MTKTRIFIKNNQTWDEFLQEIEDDNLKVIKIVDRGQIIEVTLK